MFDTDTIGLIIAVAAWSSVLIAGRHNLFKRRNLK